MKTGQQRLWTVVLAIGCVALTAIAVAGQEARREAPAMLIELVDRTDPVEVDDHVTYIIKVTNQGSAENTNVRVVCTVPNEQQYASSNGPTAATAEGQKVTFAPLPRLAPRAVATFKVTVKNVKPGDVRFAAEFTSDQVTSPVRETESTHIYQDKPTASKSSREPAFQDDFNADWKTTQKVWKVATWKQNGTQMAPERCAVDGKGCLVQTVLAGEPYRGGSMQTDKEFPYGRWQARVKPSSVPGVLNSIFTMDWDDLTTSGTDNDGSKFEVDIEFLTYTFGKNRGKVHLAVHVPEKKNAFVEDVELKFNPSDDFHVWGFDILPDKIVWHVDGKPLRTFERPKQYTFHPNYEFFFNSWSSKNWINGPAKADAQYMIDWVKFYPAQEKGE